MPRSTQKPPSPIPRIPQKVASKRATFAPKRGMGEGGFFPPQQNRMGKSSACRLFFVLKFMKNKQRL